MLGKKSSLKSVLKLLKAEGIKNVRTTRFDPVRTSRAADFSLHSWSAYLLVVEDIKIKYSVIINSRILCNYVALLITFVI